MKTRKEIGKRIKELRKKKNFSQSFVAENLFISQSAYSLIENSQNGIVVDHIIKLSNLYDVPTDFILKGEKNLVKMSPENGFVPLIRANAHAGFIKNFGKEHHYEAYDWYRIPGFNPSKEEKLFEVEGESMVPTVLPGDVLICQPHQQLDKVLDGTVAIVVTNKEVLVKRLRLDVNPNYLVLENDNPEQSKEHKLEKSDINQVLIVRGKISSVLVPYHEIASKGKIKAMEEAIEMLKKELYNVSKKLNALTAAERKS